MSEPYFNGFIMLREWSEDFGGGHWHNVGVAKVIINPPTPEGEVAVSLSGKSFQFMTIDALKIFGEKFYQNLRDFPTFNSLTIDDVWPPVISEEE